MLGMPMPMFVRSIIIVPVIIITSLVNKQNSESSRGQYATFEVHSLEIKDKIAKHPCQWGKLC